MKGHLNIPSAFFSSGLFLREGCPGWWDDGRGRLPDGGGDEQEDGDLRQAAPGVNFNNILHEPFFQTIVLCAAFL